MMRGDELVELSGADAGLDLIYLAHRCRGFLTGNRQPARRLSGVYCDCGYPELYEVLDGDLRASPAPGAAGAAPSTTEGSTPTWPKDRSEPVKSYRCRSLVAAGLDDRETRRA